MTGLQPLTSAELADLKAKAKAATPENGSAIVLEFYLEADREFYYAANPETILRLIATIEQQREQIEKLRQALEYCAVAPGALNPQNQAQFMIAREALATTELFNDKR